MARPSKGDEAPDDEAPDDAILARHYLETVRAELTRLKRQGEGAMGQLKPEQFAWAPDPESNSVAVIVRHLEGNLRSRWTDPLHSDGEKPDRDRDAEFLPGDDDADPAAVLARWERGFAVLFAALDALTPNDLTRTITIRSEPHTVLQALERGTAHLAGHVGQIVYLAKHLRGEDWRTLSIAKGASAAQRPRPPES